MSVGFYTRELFGRKIIGSVVPDIKSSGTSGFSGYCAYSGESGRSSGFSGLVCGPSGSYVGSLGSSGPSGFSGVAGFSHHSSYSRSSPCPCPSCRGFSGTSADTARFTFTVSEKDWTDVCMFIKEGYQVEASPGEILWQAEGEQDPIGRKMTESVMLSLIVKEDRTGEIRITVSDGSTYDVTRKSLAYVPEVPGAPHPGYDHDDGLLWVSTPRGAFEAKLKVQKSKAIKVRDFSLEIPDDAKYIMYYDGHYLMYFDAKENFGCDESEMGLAHDASFAAVVAAEWRRKCLLRTTLPVGQQACGCENCRMAEEWQKFYEATVDMKPKPTPGA